MSSDLCQVHFPTSSLCPPSPQVKGSYKLGEAAKKAAKKPAAKKVDRSGSRIASAARLLPLGWRTHGARRNGPRGSRVVVIRPCTCFAVALLTCSATAQAPSHLHRIWPLTQPPWNGLLRPAPPQTKAVKPAADGEAKPKKAAPKKKATTPKKKAAPKV
jgi:hypothetical protein